MKKLVLALSLLASTSVFAQNAGELLSQQASIGYALRVADCYINFNEPVTICKGCNANSSVGIFTLVTKKINSENDRQVVAGTKLKVSELDSAWGNLNVLRTKSDNIESVQYNNSTDIDQMSLETFNLLTGKKLTLSCVGKSPLLIND